MANEELIIKLGMLEQKAGQIEQQVKIIDENLIELDKLKNDLDELKGSKGREIMASIGRGIFVKGKLESEELLVDIGGKSFVKKNVEDTKKMVQAQLEKLTDVRVKLFDELNSLNQQLQDAIGETEEKIEEMGEKKTGEDHRAEEYIS